MEVAKEWLMNRGRSGFLILLIVSTLIGCGPKGLEAYRGYNLGAAESIVASAIESAGGLAAWRRAGLIRANALMTIYADDGQAYVNRQKHEIDVNARRLTIEAMPQEAGGRPIPAVGTGVSP